MSFAVSMTTAALRGAIPWATPAPLGLSRVPIGVDVHTGAGFAFDPFQAYQRGLVTDPVMIVIGSKGSGKSTLLKSLGVRLGSHEYLIRHIDPKGEGSPLATHFGSKLIRPEEGTINPFDGLGEGMRATQARGQMARAILGAALGRGLVPVEAAAINTAVSGVTDLTLEVVGERLASPGSLVGQMRIRGDDVRDLVAALSVLRSGPAALLFGESTIAIDPTAPYIGVDLSGHGEDTLPVVMVAVQGWLQATFGAARARPKLVLIDEAWRLLGHVEIARFLKLASKLSRDHGAAYLLVFQHLGDLRSISPEAQELAAGLLADTETRIVYRQPTDQTTALRTLLGLTDEEIHEVTRLPQGVGLWKVAGRSVIVQHVLAASEAAIIDTDQNMGGRTR